MLVVFLAAAVAGTAGWMIWRTRRRARPRAVPPPTRRPHGRAEPMGCPSCGREFPAGTRFCLQDARPLVPLAQLAQAAGPGNACRSCNRQFDPSIRFCPFDGAELVGPLPLLVPPQRAAAAAALVAVGRICPHCNQRYPAAESFCARDGAALVAVN